MKLQQYPPARPIWRTVKHGVCDECHTSLKDKKAFIFPTGNYAFCEIHGMIRYNALKQENIMKTHTLPAEIHSTSQLSFIFN